MSQLRLAVVMMLLCASTGTAWCQNTSKAKAQFDELTRAVLPMAIELLRSHGEFPPFGAGAHGKQRRGRGFETRGK